MREFGFELSLCATLEAEHEGVVSRQIGGGVARPGGRVIDVCHVVPGREFEERTRLTPDAIPVAAIESDVGRGRARFWKGAFDCHPERARRAVDRAVEIGFFERELRGSREYVRQTARYPDWVGRLVAVENKPDLGTPGALETQLRTDASLGVFDEVVLCTESYVTGAHENRIPDEVGIWRFDPDAHGGGDLTVVREPTRLDVTESGVELLDRQPGRADVAVVSAEEKASARRRIAERAYGKGWRTYELPGCSAMEPTEGGLPFCAYKDRLVDPANCGPACSGFDPADPPAVDLDGERAARTDWDPDPPERARRQSGLDRFRSN